MILYTVLETYQAMLWFSNFAIDLKWVIRNILTGSGLSSKENCSEEKVDSFFYFFSANCNKINSLFPERDKVNIYLR